MRDSSTSQLGQNHLLISIMDSTALMDSEYYCRHSLFLGLLKKESNQPTNSDQGLASKQAGQESKGGAYHQLCGSRAR